MVQLKQAERRVAKVIRQLQHLSCEERLGELRLSSLENRMLHGHSILTFQYLKGSYNKDGDRLFNKACNNRTRGNVF